MKSYGMILFYLFSWSTIITGAMFLGLLLFAVAPAIFVFSSYFAFLITVPAFMSLQGEPYLSAARTMRKLISNRCLSIMPNFSVRVGVVLLVLTIITARFLPLIGWLFGMPGMTITFALELFIIISLYTGLMQLLLPSQHKLMSFRLLPFVIVFLLNIFVAFKNPELNLLFVIEISMVALAVLFGTLSKIRFNRVDWQMLKPALNKRAQATS